MEELIREGMLLIHVWDGAGWQPAGFVWEVGPAINKRIVVEVPVPANGGNTFKVKLGCPPGTWLVYSVQADFSVNPAPAVTELPVTKAVNHKGEDIRQLLEASDRVYYLMPEKNDYADIEFTAIPTVPDHERSFIVKTGGYYKMNVPAEGEPQVEALRQLNLPGGYSRFALRLLNEEMSIGEKAGRIPN